MDQHQVRLDLAEHSLHPQQAFGGDSGQGLARLHDVQIKLWVQVKDLQHRVQHLAVLGGDAAQALNLRPGGQFLYQGHILMASGRVPKTLRIRSFSMF